MVPNDKEWTSWREPIMAVKEGFRAKAEKARQELLSTGKVVLRAPALLRWTEAGIRFLLAAVLSGAEIFGGYAPFGVALVGASDSGLGGFAALVGACFGYLTVRGLVNGLRYAAAAVLVFAVSFAFYDLKIRRKTWFMPVVTAALTGCTGFVYLSQAGWRTADVIFFGTELLLTAGATYFYRVAFGGWRREQEGSLKRTVSVLILGFTALISLAQITLLGDISLGRILAALAVLLCATEGGLGAGAAVGISAGVAMDMAAGGGPFYSMIYAFAGLVAGVFGTRGKLLAALSFVLADALALLWTWDGGLRAWVLYEVFIATILFMLLPQKTLRRVGVLFREEDEESGDFARSCVRRCVRDHLSATADAFRELYESMRSAFRPAKPNDGDTATIFDRTASRVCKRCALRSTCWEREYVGTFNALNDAIPAMMDRGRGEPGDFAPWFSSRCLQFPEFLAAANEELSALLYRRQYHGRLQENRAAVVGQYARLASVLRTAAAEIGEEPLPDPTRERRLRKRMEELEIEGEAAIYCDRQGRLRAELAGHGCRRLAEPEELERLSVLLGVPLTVEGEETGDRLTLCEAEPLKAVIGAAVRQKTGETVSGDAGVCFKGEDGRLYVLLCDGMGSGPAASRESSLTVRLLEQFLKAGADAETALRTLNGALALRGEQEGGFSTIDLLELDLFSGAGSLYKYGAAPSFIRKGGLITRCGGNALPAGLAGEDEPPAITRLKLSAGDCVVMVSDGILSGAEEENALRDALRAFDGDSPNALAQTLMGDGTAADDKTALVLCLRERAG